MQTQNVNSRMHLLDCPQLFKLDRNFVFGNYPTPIKIACRQAPGVDRKKFGERETEE